MNLLLVQHGQAQSEAEDPQRSLSQIGIDDSEKVAKWLSRASIEVAQIRHSGKQRAEQTASIFARHLSPRPDVVEAAGLKPMDDVHPMGDLLAAQKDTLMLVGHLPYLSRLAGLLVAANPEHEVLRFYNSGVVCLEESEGRWCVEWAVIPSHITG